MVRRIRCVLLYCCLMQLTGHAAAEDAPPWREHSSAYGQAREAVRRGDALPLRQVRRYLHRIAPGQVVATHYEFEFERWVYEFKIVDRQGRLRKVHLDARTGELVKMSDY